MSPIILFLVVIPLITVLITAFWQANVKVSSEAFSHAESWLGLGYRVLTGFLWILSTLGAIYNILLTVISLVYAGVLLHIQATGEPLPAVDTYTLLIAIGFANVLLLGGMALSTFVIMGIQTLIQDREEVIDFLKPWALEITQATVLLLVIGINLPFMARFFTVDPVDLRLYSGVFLIIASAVLTISFTSSGPASEKSLVFASLLGATLLYEFLVVLQFSLMAIAFLLVAGCVASVLITLLRSALDR